jgi:hypothetical protein
MHKCIICGESLEMDEMISDDTILVKNRDRLVCSQGICAQVYRGIHKSHNPILLHTTAFAAERRERVRTWERRAAERRLNSARNSTGTLRRVMASSVDWGTPASSETATQWSTRNHLDSE